MADKPTPPRTHIFFKDGHQPRPASGSSGGRIDHVQGGYKAPSGGQKPATPTTGSGVKNAPTTGSGEKK
jgi:hypothetical protein